MSDHISNMFTRIIAVAKNTFHTGVSFAFGSWRSFGPPDSINSRSFKDCFLFLIFTFCLSNLKVLTF